MNNELNWKSYKGRIIAATPILCLIAYILVGFFTHIWVPTIAIFSLIIIVPIVLSENFASSLYPILAVAGFFVLGFAFDLWHPGWLLFLTIPVYYILFNPFIKRKKVTC